MHGRTHAREPGNKLFLYYPLQTMLSKSGLESRPGVILEIFLSSFWLWMCYAYANLGGCGGMLPQEVGFLDALRPLLHGKYGRLF